MEICRNVAKYLTNPKFFAVSEAIDYAQKSGDIDDWEKVLGRKDLDPIVAFDYALTLKRVKIWKVVAAREDIPLASIWNIGKELRSIPLWEVIISRSDVNFQMALEVTLTYSDHNNLWAITLMNKGAEVATILKKAREINDAEVWSSVLSMPTIVSYFEKMELPEILPYLEDCDDLILWGIVMSKNGWILPKNIILYAKKAVSHEVWELVLAKEEVIKYLRALKPASLVSLAIEINCWELWSMVLRRIDISPKKVLECLKYVKEEKVWDMVFRREDVNTYLSKLNPKNIWLLAVEIDDSKFWRKKTVSDNILEYINSLDVKNVPPLVSKINNVALKETILAKTDIPLLDVIECVKMEENKEAWSAVIKRTDFMQYLNKLKKPEAILFAKACKSYRVWSLVFNKKNVKPEEAILLGKTMNDSCLWDVINSLPSVIAYLEPKES